MMLSLQTAIANYLHPCLGTSCVSTYVSEWDLPHCPSSTATSHSFSPFAVTTLRPHWLLLVICAFWFLALNWLCGTGLCTCTRTSDPCKCSPRNPTNTHPSHTLRDLNNTAYSRSVCTSANLQILRRSFHLPLCSRRQPPQKMAAR